MKKKNLLCENYNRVESGAYRKLASNVNVELSNDGRCKKGFKIG